MKLSAEEQNEILETLFWSNVLINNTNKCGRAWFDISTFDSLIKEHYLDVQVYGYKRHGVPFYQVAFYKNGLRQVACQNSEFLIDAFILALGETFDILPERFKPKTVVPVDYEEILNENFDTKNIRNYYNHSGRNSIPDTESE